jgi:hypothetical protein
VESTGLERLAVVFLIWRSSDLSAEDPVILLPSIQSDQPMDFLSVGCSWSDLQIQNTTRLASTPPFGVAQGKLSQRRSKGKPIFRLVDRFTPEDPADQERRRKAFDNWPLPQ